MNSLIGKKAEQFVEWLHEAKFILPPKMRLDEARQLFERKQQEEDELSNEKNSEPS